jgi:AraC-like DNA-binding protein
VGGIARRFGLATRTLRQVSADAVGLSPRRWLRVARLFRALEATSSGEGRSWRWVAARAGYHDPPHLTREFGALLGETPGRWLARRAVPVRTSGDRADG